MTRQHTPRFVALVGAIAALSLVGCSSDDDDTEIDDSPTETETETETEASIPGTSVAP